MITWQCIHCGRKVNLKKVVNIFCCESLYSKIKIKDVIFFNELWKELHTYKWKSEESCREFFNFWKIKIPCGNCKTKLKRILDEIGEDFSEEGFFPFTVKLHNIVNKELEKPEFSIQDAIERWKR